MVATPLDIELGEAGTHPRKEKRLLSKLNSLLEYGGNTGI